MEAAHYQSKDCGPKNTSLGNTRSDRSWIAVPVAQGDMLRSVRKIVDEPSDQGDGKVARRQSIGDDVEVELVERLGKVKCENFDTGSVNGVTVSSYVVVQGDERVASRAVRAEAELMRAKVIDDEQHLRVFVDELFGDSRTKR